MKKISHFLFYSLTILSLLVCNSCSKEEVEIDKSLILGSWHEVTEFTEVIWSFNSNNTASQKVIITFNGYVVSNVTNSYDYVYNKNKTITFTSSKSDTFTYEVTVKGDNMKLGNAEAGYWQLTRM